MKDNFRIWHKQT